MRDIDWEAFAVAVIGVIGVCIILALVGGV